MKFFGHKCTNELFLLLITFCLSMQTARTDYHEEDSWVEPNAWSREYQQQEHVSINSNNNKLEGSGDRGAIYEATATCNCDNNKSTTNAEDAVAMVYFRKFVTTLFDRSKLKVKSVKLKISRLDVYL